MRGLAQQVIRERVAERTEGSEAGLLVGAAGQAEHADALRLAYQLAEERALASSGWCGDQGYLPGVPSPLQDVPEGCQPRRPSDEPSGPGMRRTA